ncbi:MAG: hypothetical protein GY859_35790, partial [Desulfobacterales bacterium]|nr:hypothetical protein [Desulfobacterales bacterium]
EEGDVKYEINETEENIEIIADPESGSGWVYIRAVDAELLSIYKEAKVYIGCPYCENDGDYCNELEGGGFVGLSSIDVRFSLGRAAGGISAGELFLSADQISPAAAAATALRFYTLARDVEEIYDEDHAPRQILAPKTLVDITTNDEFSYEIKFYRPSDIEEKTEGLYTLTSSAAPFTAWRIENPDASPGGNRLRVTEIKEGVEKSHEYALDPDANAWSLDKGDGLRMNTRSETV